MIEIDMIPIGDGNHYCHTVYSTSAIEIDMIPIGDGNKDTGARLPVGL